ERAVRPKVPDVPRTGRKNDHRRGPDGTAAVERPAEPRWAEAGAAAAHDGLVRRLSPQRERDDARPARAARLRDVPPLGTEPHLSIIRHPRPTDGATCLYHSPPSANAASSSDK